VIVVEAVALYSAANVGWGIKKNRKNKGHINKSNTKPTPSPSLREGISFIPCPWQGEG
jgi:hypothetical protein